MNLQLKLETKFLNVNPTNMKHFLLAIAAIFFGVTLSLGQNLNKTWKLDSYDKENTNFKITDTSLLKLEDGVFEYSTSFPELKSSGNYIHQNNLILFYYSKPNDTIRKFNIEKLSDSTLVLAEKNVLYNYTNFKADKIVLDNNDKKSEVNPIIPSQGFSLDSLWRGVLGMVTLIFIAFLFSSNRKAINWKTVGIGLAFQLVIAVSVLKVEFVKSGFEYVGQGFIAILGFTQAGSEFLFGDMLDIDSFGYIFAFQVLPTIIFFSALTSVLFYLGIIQKIVKGMCWLLTKVLGISGAESLSVAGNVFLGQTEAPLLIKAYLEKMNKSEILLVMIGGMATVAGAVLAAYIGFLGGDDPELQLF